MIDTMLDIARSLTTLMAEESEQLSVRGQCADHVETVGAKRRLVAQLNTEVARLNREKPDWAQHASEQDNAALSEAMATLRDAAAHNVAVVDRHLSLSNEMIDAVAAEARRLTGNRGWSYRDTGMIMQRSGTSPISVNTRL